MENLRARLYFTDFEMKHYLIQKIFFFKSFYKHKQNNQKYKDIYIYNYKKKKREREKKKNKTNKYTRTIHTRHNETNTRRHL